MNVPLLRKTWALWLLILIVTYLLYSGTLNYGILYNYDDDAYFQDPTIRELSVSHIGSYFSTFYLGMYQPLSVASYAVVLKIFPESVEAQRVVNLFIHILNALMVLLLVTRVSKNKLVGFLTALVFAIHPMHVESVTWIATRGNLLYSLFYLSTLVLWFDWREKGGTLRMTGFILCFILALFSKVTATTLPFILVLLDYFLFRDRMKRSIFLYVPFFLLSAAMVWVGVRASGSFGHITELKFEYSFIDRIFLVAQALWLYFIKAFVPFDQSVIYLYPWKVAGSLPLSYYLAGTVIVIILGGLLYLGWKNRERKESQAILLGLLFFLFTLSVVLPLKWSRTILIAERYTYLPYIGLFAALFYAGQLYLERYATKIRQFVYAMLGLVLIVYAYLTYERNKVWQNPITLFSDVVDKDRSGAEVSMGYYNKGNELLRLGRFDEALEDYTTAIKIYPEYCEAFYNRGLVYYYKQQYEPAVTDFTRSISIDDRNPNAFLNRGIAYRSIGMAELALKDFDVVISKLPSGIAYFNRGALYYFNLNDAVKACEDWKKADAMGFATAKEVLEKFCK